MGTAHRTIRTISVNKFVVYIRIRLRKCKKFNRQSTNYVCTECVCAIFPPNIERMTCIALDFGYFGYDHAIMPGAYITIPKCYLKFIIDRWHISISSNVATTFSTKTKLVDTISIASILIQLIVFPFLLWNSYALYVCVSTNNAISILPTAGSVWFGRLNVTAEDVYWNTF